MRRQKHWARFTTAILITVFTMLPAAGCGGTSSATTASTGASQTGATPRTMPLPTTTTTPTLASNPESRHYMTMLKETYDASNIISSQLQQKGLSSSDPATAQVFGLRARAQAITARKAMVDNNPSLADAAVIQMRKLLSQGQAVGQGDVLAPIVAALATIEGLPQPSADSAGAAESLDAVIEDLSPLMP